MKSGRLIAILLAGLILCGGCGQPGCAHDPTATHASVSDRMPLTLGDREITVRVALSRQEQAKGLMYCESLPENEGMIFPFREPQKMSFWMNHVPIPLAAGFIRADGTLAEIREMLPNDTRTVYSAGDDIQYVLEMNGGWFERHGVAPGEKLDMEQLGKLLESRGVNPSDYIR